jgi:hypothetical protein
MRRAERLLFADSYFGAFFRANVIMKVPGATLLRFEMWWELL